MRRVVLLTIDGWGTNLLGCYGNPLCETPHFDDLAARSQVFDQCFACSSNLIENLNAVATGRHPLEVAAEPSRILDKKEMLSQLDVPSCFISDDTSLADWPGIKHFSEAVLVAPDEVLDPGEADMESDWASTHMARFMQTAIGEWKRFSDATDHVPSWVWMHLSGLTKHWDAPWEYRMRLCDPESDPEPPTTQLPMQFLVTDATDPDAVFGATCCAAAQGIVLDHLMAWVAAFLDHLHDREDCLFIVMGTRGYPLGEHRAVGLDDETLYHETLHVPLLIQAGTPPIGSREPQLIQPTAIHHLIQQWLGKVDDSNRSQENDLQNPSHACAPPSWEAKPDATREQGFALATSGDGLAIIHGRWSMVMPHVSNAYGSQDPQPSAPELYLFPDDRWQQNNVATRAGEVAKALETFGHACADWIHQGSSACQPLCDSIVYRAIS